MREYFAKNSGPHLRESVSQATALAPFSQNSKKRRSLSGSSQAQLGQSIPLRVIEADQGTSSAE